MCWRICAECAPTFFRARRARNQWLLYLVIRPRFFFSGAPRPESFILLYLCMFCNPPYCCFCALRTHDHILYYIYLCTPLIYSLSYLCTHLIYILVHIRLPVCYHLLLLYIWHCPRSYFAKFYTPMVTYGNFLVWSPCTIFPEHTHLWSIVSLSCFLKYWDGFRIAFFMYHILLFELCFGDHVCFHNIVLYCICFGTDCVCNVFRYICCCSVFVCVIVCVYQCVLLVICVSHNVFVCNVICSNVFVSQFVFLINSMLRLILL